MRHFVTILLLCISVPAAAEIGRWEIDYGASRLGFSAEQAGARFDGRFKTFEADVHLDPDALQQSTATVFVETGSVDTSDQERDGILRGAGWFESETFPRAQFTAREFAKTDAGYVAKGELKIGKATCPVTFLFTLEQRNGRIELNGTTTLDRFALGLGLGDWADTKWIGKRVDVTVALIGTR